MRDLNKPSDCGEVLTCLADPSSTLSELNLEPHELEDIKSCHVQLSTFFPAFHLSSLQATPSASAGCYRSTFKRTPLFSLSANKLPRTQSPTSTMVKKELFKRELFHDDYESFDDEDFKSPKKAKKETKLDDTPSPDNKLKRARGGTL